jgi:hypothetical protein
VLSQLSVDTTTNWFDQLEYETIAPRRRIHVEVVGYLAGQANFRSIVHEFTLIPEPASGLLGWLSLWGLTGFRRRLGC